MDIASKVPANVPKGVGYSFQLPHLKVTILEDGPQWKAKQLADAEKKKNWIEDEKKLLDALREGCNNTVKPNSKEFWIQYTLPVRPDLFELLDGNAEGLLAFIKEARDPKGKDGRTNALLKCHTPEGLGIRTLVAFFGSIEGLKIIESNAAQGDTEWSFGNRYGYYAAILGNRLDLAKFLLDTTLPKTHWGRIVSQQHVAFAKSFGRYDIASLFETHNRVEERKSFDARVEYAKKNGQPVPVWKEPPAPTYEFPRLTNIAAGAVAMMLWREQEKLGRPILAKLSNASDDIIHLVLSGVMRHVSPWNRTGLVEYLCSNNERFRGSLDSTLRRKLSQTHSKFLRKVAGDLVCPRDPKRMNILNVFDEKTLQTFHCTAEDAAEKKLEKYFEAEKTRLSRVPGEMSVVSSLEQFRRNLNAFAGGQLRHLNWKNVMVIGGAVGASLLPIPPQFVGHEDRYFNQEATAWGGSDIDLCLYGVDESDVLPKLKEIYDSLRKAYPEVPITILSTREAVTFARHYPYRPIQVMGNFPSIAEVIADIDIDCTAAAYDGTHVWALPRAREALNSRINIASSAFHTIRGCPQYEKRLVKYAKRGFIIGDPLLRRSAIDPAVLNEPSKETEWKFRYEGNDDGNGSFPGVGMKMLLLAEKYPWVCEKLMKMCTDNSIPFGPEWTRALVEKKFQAKKSPPAGDGNGEDEENAPAADDGWNLNDMHNAFDGYTHYYQPPVVLKSLDDSQLHITGNHRPFLIPKWKVDMRPGEKHRNRWQGDDEEEEEGEEEVAGNDEDAGLIDDY